MPYIGTPPASELANLDINGQSLILDADADTHITADTDDQIDIHIAGADDFQFTANTFTAQSGSTIAAQALTATNIKTGDGSVSAPSVTFSNDTNTGIYSYGADQLGIAVSGANPVMIQSSKVYINENANVEGANGLTINQTTADDEIFTLKSSDVCHSVTDNTEDDTFFAITKKSNSGGGALLEGFAESNLTDAGLMIRGYSEGASGTRSTSGTAPVMVDAVKANSSGGGAVDSNANIFVVQNNGTTRWLIDSEGDVYADGSHNDSGWDEWDDVALLTAARHVSVRNKEFAKNMFGDFISEHADVLNQTGVIKRNDDGSNFVSTKGLNGLIIDAIRQTRNIQKAFYNILSDEQKNKFAGELNEMKLPVLPAFQTP